MRTDTEFICIGSILVSRSMIDTISVVVIDHHAVLVRPLQLLEVLINTLLSIPALSGSLTVTVYLVEENVIAA